MKPRSILVLGLVLSLSTFSAFAADDEVDAEQAEAAAAAVEADVSDKKAEAEPEVNESATVSKLEGRIEALETVLTVQSAQLMALEKAVASSKASAAANAKNKITAAPIRGGFEQVPAEQSDALVTRLDLISEIITKHGRAYDYRTMTIKELRAVLASLETKIEAKAETKAAAKKKN